MPQHRIKLIVNPNADLGRAFRRASELRAVVDEYGGADWAGSVYPTHAITLAEQAADEGYEIVVAAGGDGTSHEVVNGLMKVPAKHRPKFGVLPLGSGNDFSHAIGIDADPIAAVRQVFTGNLKHVDIGRYWDGIGRSEYFVNTIGIGFDTSVTIRSRSITILSGFMIYMVAVLQTILFDHVAPVIKVHTDLEDFEEAFVMFVVCNGGREGGGFNVAPKAKVDDGIFHYTGVRHVSRLMMLRLLPKFMKGTHEGFMQIRSGVLGQIKLESDRPLYIHTDGEIFAGWGMDVRQLGVEILPAELEVIV